MTGMAHATGETTSATESGTVTLSRRNTGRGGAVKNLIGQRFNKLVVVAFAGVDPSGARWLCECVCYNFATARSCDLRSEQKKSCGCHRRQTSQRLGRRNVLTDVRGQRFGRLVVQSYAGAGRWYCRCNCGTVCKVLRRLLIKGCTKSCGCLQSERAGRLNLIHGHARIGSTTREFTIWSGMKQRCNNPNHISYPNYGGRGIEVCGRWLNGENGLSGYECFFADVGERPSPLHSIDRWPDNDGNYEPGNVRWATGEQQAANKGRARPQHMTGAGSDPPMRTPK